MAWLVCVLVLDRWQRSKGLFPYVQRIPGMFHGFPLRGVGRKVRFVIVIYRLAAAVFRQPCDALVLVERSDGVAPYSAGMLSAQLMTSVQSGYQQHL